MTKAHHSPLAQVPIEHIYQTRDSQVAAQLAAASMPLGFGNGPFVEVNSYHRAGHKGALPKMLARKSVVEALHKATSLCGSGVKIVIFDAFRTRTTQRFLFEMIRKQIAESNPTWSNDEVLGCTRQFVVHPDETSRFKIAPHNSGGAVDVTLMVNDLVLDMGTEFDEVSPLSRTDAFEEPYNPATGFSESRWMTVRQNRRILFNALKSVGFVNYDEEWWHYDLGDCIWAQTLGIDWFYPSMEDELSQARI